MKRAIKSTIYKMRVSAATWDGLISQIENEFGLTAYGPSVLHPSRWIHATDPSGKKYEIEVNFYDEQPMYEVIRYNIVEEL